MATQRRSGSGWAMLLLLFVVASTAAKADFSTDFDITWGGDGYHTQTSDGGKQIQLLLDRSSGGAFQSKKQYLFGRFDVGMRLVQGDSAGTVTTFYLSSQGDKHDEIDMEFLGNVSGQPYVLHTNIYSAGKGQREEQFYLWFDPTRGFHTYSMLWTPSHIVLLVDNIPIRVYTKTAGVAFPESQPMRVYGSLWNADDWATRGGRDKTDWSKAPFSAGYRLFRTQPCLPASSATCTVSSSDQWWNQLPSSSTTSTSSASSLAANNNDSNAAVNAAMQKLKWVQSNYRIYSYCNDLPRFNGSRPLDCASTS